MKKYRKNNYDLLRIVCAFEIILLHVSGRYMRCDEMGIPSDCSLIIMLTNHITRFAVPCFLMLSGAFILADEKNADYKYFYYKSIRKIGIIGIIFCFLYVLYSITKLIIGIIISHNNMEDIFSKIFNILIQAAKGSPYYHLWYLFTLIGLYIASPFVIRLAKDLQLGG